MPKSPSKSEYIEWVTPGESIQIGSQLLYVAEATVWFYPEQRSPLLKGDVVESVEFWYTYPVPGASPYCLDLRSQMFRPLKNETPPSTTRWGIYYAGSTARKIRKLYKQLSDEPKRSTDQRRSTFRSSYDMLAYIELVQTQPIHPTLTLNQQIRQVIEWKRMGFDEYVAGIPDDRIQRALTQLESVMPTLLASRSQLKINKTLRVKAPLQGMKQWLEINANVGFHRRTPLLVDFTLQHNDYLSWADRIRCWAIVEQYRISPDQCF